MPLNNIGLPLAELDRVCPFHIIVNATENSPQILRVGGALRKLVNDGSSHPVFDKVFSISRPRSATLDFLSLSQSDNMIVLKHRDSDLCLRGLFIPLGDAKFLFFCSVEITSADCLGPLGLTINDFSAADPTPDIIILHRFRDMQAKDQHSQIEELRRLVVARDTLDLHANTDMLTGIGNRRMFWAHGSEMLRKTLPGQVVAILLMDLNGFKQINDAHGHEAGDAVLKTVASRCVSVASDQGIVARLGGDEFVMLLRTENQAEVETFVDNLHSAIHQPMVCAGRHLDISVSMGVSILEPAQSIDEAFHYADLAMHDGRDKCKGVVSWFTPEMQTIEDYRKSLELEIRGAIANGEIVPFFQPIVDIRHKRVHGYEALARWQHPVHGMIFPDTFINLAADAGCLHELDYAILELALKQLAIWDTPDNRLSLHVNLCGTSVRKGLDKKVMRLLRDLDIESSRLTLELTETTLLEFGDDEIAVLARLAEKGVSIQLDDFGTGYSSLTHLHDFPVDGLKIDRSFLHGFPTDNRRRQLIESVLSIANHLNLDVVTEGIEVAEQMDWIASTGCRYGQGYLFGKPVASSECHHTLSCWPSLEKAA